MTKQRYTIKPIFYALPILVLILLMAFPDVTFSGAKNGVVLWFERLLPSLLPSLIISGIFLKVVGKSLGFPVIYAVLTGLLCGHPVGVMACLQSFGKDEVKARQTQWLLALVSMPSPMFVVGYVFNTCLGIKFKLIQFIYIYIPTLSMILVNIIYATAKTGKTEDLITFVNDVYNDNAKIKHQKFKENTRKKSCFNVKILDEAIMDGFETITRIGGYVILFSIVVEFLNKLPLTASSVMVLSGITEITGGINLLVDLNRDLREPLVAFFLGFGGLSCIMQTKSVIEGSFYSIKKYVCHKLVIGTINMIAAMLMTYV